MAQCSMVVAAKLGTDPAATAATAGGGVGREEIDD